MNTNYKTGQKSHWRHTQIRGGNRMDSRRDYESVCMGPGLYRPEFEHDNCGIGAVVNIKGIKTHQTVENALKIVE